MQKVAKSVQAVIFPKVEIFRTKILWHKTRLIDANRYGKYQTQPFAGKKVANVPTKTVLAQNGKNRLSYFLHGRLQLSRGTTFGPKQGFIALK